MGAFCCHGNQSKRHITIILAIFKGPNQVTFLLSKGQIASMALKELSFESVSGQTDGRTADKKVITIAHPEHSSDEQRTFYILQINTQFLRVE